MQLTQHLTRHLTHAPTFASRIRPFLAALLVTLVGAAGAHAQVHYLTATIDATQETPPNSSLGTGSGCFELDVGALTLTYNIQFAGLTAAQTGAHIHGFAPPGTAAPVLFPLALGSPISGTIALTAGELAGILNGQTYVNIHTSNYPNGEIRGQIVRAPAPTAFCWGDGSDGACPCGNDAAPGAGTGCVNSTGAGAALEAEGFASLVCDTLKLTGVQMPGPSTAIYLQGSATLPATIFGDGLRCIGSTLTRLAVVTNVGGSSHIPGAGTPGVSILGSIGAPGTFYYQTYYRDPDLAFCAAPPGNSFNITNAVEVVWVP